MVVLDSAGASSSNSSQQGNNQYLQPDLMGPFASSMDSKTSPLALLAQTCNQIGADITPVKSLEKPKSFEKDNKKCNSPGVRSTNEKKDDDRHKSSQSPAHQKGDSRSSVGRPTSSHSQVSEPKLQAPSADPFDAYRMMGLSAAYNPFSAYAAGLDPATAAALGVGLQMRNPYQFPSGFPSSPIPSLGGLSIPTSMGHLSAAMMNYGRPKPTECRDPYCTTCPPTASHQNPQNSMCPLGCSQCDHPKVPLPPTSTAAPTVSAPSESPSTPKPYVCNWVAGTDYCGKKFVSSDELLQHLRTHTSTSGEPSTSYSSTLAAAAAANPLLSRGYPPMSHLAAASRYHPYAKPNSMPSASGMQLPNLSGYPGSGASSAAAHHMLFGSGLSPFGGMHGSQNPMSLGQLQSLQQASGLNSLGGLGGMPPSFGLGGLNSTLSAHPALASYYSSQLSLYGQRP